MSTNVTPLRHERERRLIAQSFGGGLSASRWRQLKGHLDDCDSCRALYEQHQRLERMLCHGDEAAVDRPTVFQLERNEAVILAGVASGEAPPRRLPAWAAVIPVIVATAAAALLMIGAPMESDRVPLAGGARFADVELRDQLQARGGRYAESPVGVRLFRVVEAKRSGEVVEAAAGRGSSALAIDDIITFSYTSATDAATPHRYLTLVGVQSDGLRWYYPGYGDDEQQSVGIESGVVDEPLGDGIRLSVHHRPGALRIYALFSPEPLAKQAVARELEALGATKETVGASDMAALSARFAAVEVFGFTVQIGERADP
jgi:hypothetical protein